MSNVIVYDDTQVGTTEYMAIDLSSWRKKNKICDCHICKRENRQVYFMDTLAVTKYPDGRECFWLVHKPELYHSTDRDKAILVHDDTQVFIEV